MARNAVIHERLVVVIINQNGMLITNPVIRVYFAHLLKKIAIQ